RRLPKKYLISKNINDKQMKRQGRRQSSNVDDRRGLGGPRMGSGGLNPFLIGSLLRILFSMTGMILLAVFLGGSFILVYNPLSLLSGLLGGGGQGFTSETSYTASPKEEEMAQFSATILADTEDVWNQQLGNYREPTLVLFSGSVSSACGTASSATGPFYCP